MSSLLHFFDEIKFLLPVFLKLLEAFRRVRQRCLSLSEPLDFASIERELAEVTSEVERCLIRESLMALDIRPERLKIKGVVYRPVMEEPMTYYSLAGEIVLPRMLWRPAGQPNAKTVDVVSLRAGCVGEGWLPQIAKALAFAIQQNPSREAVKLMEQVKRLPYSRASFERVAHEVGKHVVANQEAVEEQLIEEFKTPEEAASISVSLDRVSIPMEEPAPHKRLERPKKGKKPVKRPVERNYRMAYCGTVTTHDKEGKSLHTICYGRMPKGDAEALCAGIAGDVRVILRQRQDLRVVALCDGAKEMWNLLLAAFEEAEMKAPEQCLVDIWHTVEKLGKAAEVIVEDSSAKEQKQKWKLKLLNMPGAASVILEELRRSGKEFVKVKGERPVHEAITYLENNVERMNYAEARSKGLPVGSGNVEATCKSLFQVRMKRGGMRWKEVSGEEIVQLRALGLSDRWKRGVQLALAPLRCAMVPCALAA